jgi:2,4-diaminopentanoate dehydrogenase
MTENKTYRVIQWATGNVGSVAVRHLLENPQFELAAVLVTDPSKNGKDVGELTGLSPCGVIATNDVEAIVAAEADCVHFAPSVPDIPMMCRLLRSGKNVVSPLGPFYRTERFNADCDMIEAACRDGGTSFHGSGIHPGFSGDLLPLTLIRIMERVDAIHIYEVVDHLANPSRWLEFMGFGHDCDALLANPTRGPDAPHFFAQAMAMVVESLGKTVEKLTTNLEVAPATRDIVYAGGVVKAGTVAGQHYEWTAWVDGVPFITYHFYWTMGRADVEQKWDFGEPGYRIVIDGNPPMDVTMRRPPPLEHGARYISLWTAMAGINAIPAVCEAKPGMVTHRNLGVVEPRGLVRNLRR